MNPLIPLLKSLYHFLIWGNLLMAASAAGWVVVVCRGGGIPADGVLALLTFALAIAFYTRDRLDANSHPTDLLTLPDRTRWMRRHHRALRLWMWLGAIVGVGCLLLRPMAVIPILAGLGFALTYTLRWIPWQGQRRAWRQLPGMKMPSVALLWTLLVVGCPVAVYPALRTPTMAGVAFAIFLLIMVQILVNDLRDIKGDAADGTYSLPVLLGNTKARLVGIALALLAFSSTLPLGRPALPLTAVYALVLVLGYRRRHESYWRPWVEGVGILPLLLP